MHKRFHQWGFTLIELLVVISIIGILIALGTASYTTAQKKGRDAKRQADMKAVQSALEQYNSIHGVYPPNDTEDTDLLEVLPAGWPTDPKTGLAYPKTFDTAAGSYCICAQLDQEGTGNATDASCSFGQGADSDYFCVTNLM